MLLIYRVADVGFSIEKRCSKTDKIFATRELYIYWK